MNSWRLKMRTSRGSWVQMWTTEKRYGNCSHTCLCPIFSRSSNLSCIHCKDLLLPTGAGLASQAVCMSFQIHWSSKCLRYKVKVPSISVLDKLRLMKLLFVQWQIQEIKAMNVAQKKDIADYTKKLVSTLVTVLIDQQRGLGKVFKG